MYGLKRSGQAWRTHFAQMLESIGFTFSNADLDVWYKPGVKQNSEEYYLYLLVYVDDLLCIDCIPSSTWIKSKGVLKLEREVLRSQGYTWAHIVS